MKIHLIILLLITLVSCNNNVKHFHPRLNDGIEVGAPDQWRWIRDGLNHEAIQILAGVPAHKNNAIKSIPHSLGVWKYKTEIPDVYHELIFSQKNQLVSCQWYKGMKEDSSLIAPKSLITKRLLIDYPRSVPISWTGDSTNGYEVEVEIMYPNGKWDKSYTYFTSDTKAVHQHTGDNIGRWKVRKISKIGYGPWSNTTEFECK